MRISVSRGQTLLIGALLSLATGCATAPNGAALSPAALAAAPSPLPPEFRLGRCYAPQQIPAKYATATQFVLKHPAGERIEMIPARFESTLDRVEVRAASTRIEIIPPATTRRISVPALYATVAVTKLVSLPATRRVAIPAEYTLVTTRKLVQSATVEWRRFHCTGPPSTASAVVATPRIAKRV